MLRTPEQYAWIEEPTPELRWVLREGEKILQQKILKRTEHQGVPEFEWRKVPIVDSSASEE